MPSHLTDQELVVALSNRLVLPLQSRNKETQETFVVRAQNMHSCVRLGAQIARDFQVNGSLLNRPLPFNWEQAWHTVTKGYEETWNKRQWACVYHNGKIIYETEKENRHLFLDVIEQCDARNKDTYDRSLAIAEDAFKHAGKLVTIQHDSNIALIVNVSKEEGKCGIILRGPDKTTTFNFTVRTDSVDHPLEISHCLSAAAAFLEGIQLAFFIGMTRQKLAYELISDSSEEALRAHDAAGQLSRVKKAIGQFEEMFTVHYRPEAPDFNDLTKEASAYARKILNAEIVSKIEDGEKTGWIA